MSQLSHTSQNESNESKRVKTSQNDPKRVKKIVKVKEGQNIKAMSIGTYRTTLTDVFIKIGKR